MHLLEELERSQLRGDFPQCKAGDTVRVYFRIREGEKERVQYFEGIVIGFHRNAVSSTFKVRKESYGVGVERTFPLHSPLIEKIEIKKRGDVRRAKLFYLRKVSGKKARIREKKDWIRKKEVVVPPERMPEGPSGEPGLPAEAAAQEQEPETAAPRTPESEE